MVVKRTGSSETRAQLELRDVATWLHGELKDLAARVNRALDVAAQMDRILRNVALKRGPEQQRLDLENYSSKLESEMASLLESFQPSESNWKTFRQSAEPHDLDWRAFADRLEHDLFDAASRASESEIVGAPRELESPELTIRLWSDLLELAARSSEAEIRAVAERSQMQVRKLVAESAHAARVPLAERYFPREGSEPKVETRRNLKIGELPDKVVAALRNAEMDARHADLDSLMQD